MRAKYLLPFVLVAAGAFTQVSCGLEMPLVAFSPPRSASFIGYMITFQTRIDHADDISRLFDGYEVYYRIVDDDEFVAISGLDDFSQLSASGFRKLYLPIDQSGSGGSIQEPLIQTAAGEGTEYDITIDFSALASKSGEPGFYSAPAGLVTAEDLRRAVPVSDLSHPDNGFFRRFSQALPGDPDIVDAGGDLFNGLNEGDQIDVIFEAYVFADGMSISTGSFFTKIRSPLCYAGYITIKMTYDDGLL